MKICALPPAPSVRATHFSPAPTELTQADTYVPSCKEDETVTVGTKREFHTWDMSVMPPGDKLVKATCRAVGEHGYIFVDDEVWGRLVSEEDVFEIDQRFHRQSPPGSVDPRAGIAENNHTYFGEPPLGLDDDPRVYILVTEMASFRGTVLDGYFNPFDTLLDEQAQEQYGQRSNEKEIVYLNAAARRIDSDYMMGVLAHEHQHLLHHQHDPLEESWLSETLGEVAMKINGYHTDIGHVVRHQAHPDRPLVSQTYVDYGACLLFGSYLTERYGKGLIQDLAQNPSTGIASLNESLENLGQPERFEGLYQDWVVANYCDARGVATPGLHYATLDPPAPSEVLVEGDSYVDQNSLRPTGARYYRLPERSLSLLLEGGDGLTAEVLEFDGPRVRRIPVDGSLSLEGPGDRVLALGSLASEEVDYTLAIA